MPDVEVLIELREFVREREWSQFHSAENLAKSISIEAGELADVLTYCYLMADRLDVDADEIVARKLEIIRADYPKDVARGKSSKYDRL